MNANTTKSGQESIDFIDFYDVWRVISNYKFSLGFFIAAVAALAIILVSKITPTYVATATLLLEEKKENSFSMPTAFDLGMNSDETKVTEMEVLRSRNMILQVIDELDLRHQPAFQRAMENKGLAYKIATLLPISSAYEIVKEDDESKQIKMAAFFERNLTVRSVPQTRIISVSYESSSSELARDIANTLAKLYIKRQESAVKENAELEAKWLDERITELSAQLQSLEQTLADFVESNDLVVIDGVSGLSAAKIKQLKGQLLKEQQRNLELESIKSLIDETGMNDPLSLLTVDYVAKNPTIQLLRQTEMQAQQKVNELSTVYGVKHPKMVAAKGELREAKKNLLNEVKVLVANTDTNLSASNHMLGELQTNLQLARKEHQENQKLENRFIRLTREIDSTRQMYEKLLQQSLRNNLTTAANVGFASIVDPAIAPPFPAKPKKKVIVGMAVFLAAAFAITFILIVDSMLNNTFRSAEDINKYLSVALLGITPKLSKLRRKKPDFAFLEKDQKGFIEAIRTIKTNLLLQLKQDPGKNLIAVTSTVAEEGKSVVAMNLAFSLAGQGKVLLIDSDLRHPSIGKRFGLSDSHPGLVELLKGEARFADCSYRDKQSGITILPAGGSCDDPLDLLFSPRFHLMLKRLKHHYRYIVIDSVQTESVSDAFVVAKKADCLLYVIKANSTKRDQVATLFTRLRAQGIEVNGVIATQVDVANKQNKERFANYYDFKNINKTSFSF